MNHTINGAIDGAIRGLHAVTPRRHVVPRRLTPSCSRALANSHPLMTTGSTMALARSLAGKSRSAYRVAMKRCLAPVVVVVVLVVAAVAAGGGCKKIAAAAAAVAAVDADAGAAASDEPDAVTTQETRIRAVFDAATPADPRALRLCKALLELPQQRKAACCKYPIAATDTVTTTCAGVLSDALHDKDLTFDDAKATACAEKRARQLDGCGWVNATAPPPPPECDEILRGNLDKGARCRSSLECNKGLRCRGAGPLDSGRCADPLPDGSRCGASVDGLAIVVDEPSIDRDHPQCKNICGHLKCRSLEALGGECRSDVECGAGNRCQANLCVAGRVAVGQPCTGATCADGARCIESKCEAPRAPGGSCAMDSDCADGGCVKHRGAPKGSSRPEREEPGVCGMKCSPLPLP